MADLSLTALVVPARMAVARCQARPDSLGNR